MDKTKFYIIKTILILLIYGVIIFGPITLYIMGGILWGIFTSIAMTNILLIGIISYLVDINFNQKYG